MKKIFLGYFKPTAEELKDLWSAAYFAFDANVLLNLYRYSDAAKNELKSAITSLENRIFVPNQAAKEFLTNRLSVTSAQAKEYENAIKELDKIVNKFKDKNKHPYISDNNIENLDSIRSIIVSELEERNAILLRKLSDDEILDFISTTFNSKTGNAFEEDALTKIVTDGSKRYENKVPPGYMDLKSKSSDDIRVYGDLIVWKQIIEFSKENNSPVIFITDDRKEDWWLEESGRTIGPRPELIEEFFKETNEKFWMFNVSSFLKYYADQNKRQLESSIVDELQFIREQVRDVGYVENDKFISKKNIGSAITVIQQPSINTDIENSGEFIISLEDEMKYATGSGKFRPVLSDIPVFDVELLDSPIEDINAIKISFGCGTRMDFNIHLKAKYGLLPVGDYFFRYSAKT